MLACLALPATTPLPLGDYAKNERIAFLVDQAAAMDLSVGEDCADPAHCLLRFA